MPIDLAVPSTVRIAASSSLAFRSGSLVVAISRIWSRLILPTLSVCGVADPLARPAAFLISSAAGGVFVTKVKVRSSKIVISTGMTLPRMGSVAAL